MAVGDKIADFHKSLKTLREAIREVEREAGKNADIPSSYKTAVDKLANAAENSSSLYGSMVEEWRSDYTSRRS